MKPTAEGNVTNPIFGKSSKLLKGDGYHTKAAKSAKGGKSSKAAKSAKEFEVGHETISRPSSKSAKISKATKSSKEGKGSTILSKANPLGLSQLERTADHSRANEAQSAFCFRTSLSFGLLFLASIIIWV